MNCSVELVCVLYQVTYEGVKWVLVKEKHKDKDDVWIDVWSFI